MRYHLGYFHTSTFFFDRIVLPLLLTFPLTFAFFPAVFSLGLLLTNLAGLRDSQIRATNRFFLTYFAASSLTLPVVLALVWVRCPLAGKPSL